MTVTSLLGSLSGERALRARRSWRCGFARRGADHFAGLEVTHGRHRVPIVPDALAHLECAVEREVTAGDHLVVFGRVQRVCGRDGEPLGFHGGKFGEVRVHGEEPAHWFG